MSDSKQNKSQHASLESCFSVLPVSQRIIHLDTTTFEIGASEQDLKEYLLKNGFDWQPVSAELAPVIVESYGFIVPDSMAKLEPVICRRSCEFRDRFDQVTVVLALFFGDGKLKSSQALVFLEVTEEMPTGPGDRSF